MKKDKDMLDVEPVAQIKLTYDYNKFIPNKEYRNYDRVQFLIWRKMNRSKSLPLVEVRKIKGKLKIVGDMDSYYAAVETKSPIYYYESFMPSVQPQKRDLYLSQEDIVKLTSTIQLYEAILDEGEKNED